MDFIEKDKQIILESEKKMIAKEIHYQLIKSRLITLFGQGDKKIIGALKSLIHQEKQ